MSFTLEAIVGSTTVNLTNGNPFSLIRATGMAGVPVRRVTAQGPAQHGDTDLGYRLNPREMELEIGFHATTDAILDGYRDTLIDIFKPLSSTPVSLKVTRDDGVVRQIDCYTIDAVRIALVKEYRPGHYHRATVRLRATEPAWYNPTQGSVAVTGTALAGAQWWLAGGMIDSDWVMEHGTVPAQGQVWTYTGTPATSYTIAFRSARETITDGKYAFFAGSASGTPAIYFRTEGTTNYAVGSANGGTLGLSAGTSNVFVSYYLTFSPPEMITWRDDDTEDDEGFNLPQQLVANQYSNDYNIAGTARRWRSNATNDAASRWSNDLEKYAVYVPAINEWQMGVLDDYMSLPLSTTGVDSMSVAYQGDLPEYPVISIRGPVTNPRITNLTTGDTLDFGTISIGAGTTYIINTHPQFRTVVAGTVNKRGELTADSDLGAFRLETAPRATGGTNVLSLNGTAVGTATQFSVTYYNRYVSF